MHVSNMRTMQIMTRKRSFNANGNNRDQNKHDMEDENLEQYNMRFDKKIPRRASKVSRKSTNKNISNGMQTNENNNSEVRDKYIGIACHGSELVVSKQDTNDENDAKYYRVKYDIPKNVNVLTVAAPHSYVSASNHIWFIRLLKEASTDHLAALFKDDEEGADVRKTLEMGLMYNTVQEVVSYMKLNLYTGGSQCPDMILSSSTSDAMVKPTACNDMMHKNHSDWLSFLPHDHVYPFSTPTSLFITRDANSNRKRLNFIPLAEVSKHPCARAICPAYEFSSNAEVAQRNGCLAKLTYAFRQDLEDQKSVCKWVTSQTGDKGVNGSQLNIANVPAADLTDAMMEASRYMRLRKQFTTPLSLGMYLSWRIAFSKRNGTTYGNKRLTGKYANSRFLLSDFISTECNDPNKNYNIIVFACRSQSTPIPVTDLKNKRQWQKLIRVHKDAVEHDYSKNMENKSWDVYRKRTEYRKALTNMTRNPKIKMTNINYPENADNGNLTRVLQRLTLNPKTRRNPSLISRNQSHP